MNEKVSNILVHPLASVSEIAQDVLFHEFGHFLSRQYGKFDTDSSLSKDFISGWLLRNKNLPLPIMNCHNGYAQVDSSCALSETKGNFFALLLGDKVNDDFAHRDYKNNAHILKFAIGSNTFINVDWENSKFKIAGIPNNFISPITGKWPFFIHHYAAEEFALTSLLWDLYDSENPSEFLDVDSVALVRETVNIPFNNFINIVLPARTTSDLYIKLIQPGQSNVALDAIFAANGICKDLIFNGKCSTFEVIDGLSAWSVRIPNGHMYSYPYIGYKYPLGRP